MHFADSKPELLRFFAFLFGVLSAIGAALVALSLYERIVLGEHSLGIGKLPVYTPYYLGRLLLAFGLALLLVAGLYRLRDGEASIDRSALSAPQRAAAYAMLTMTASGIVLFVTDPVLFYEFALEDRPLEWASALLPLASSGLFAFVFWRILGSDRRDGRRHANLAFTGLFAVGLFVTGMEEISWMQRVFDIQTPAAFAANQQQEMNLHNMHSIAFGTAHKAAMYAGLIVLPFLVETAPKNPLFDAFEDFLPSRFVLAVSAPIAAYNFNAWNFLLTPVLVFLTALIVACYGLAAWRRGDRRETTLFAALVTFIVVGQAAFLAFGANSVRPWDYSEYAELFMAIGLAVFSWQTFGRLTTRYLPKPARTFSLDAADRPGRFAGD
jgi:hypothetical protein